MKLELAFEEFIKNNPAVYQYGFASDNQTKTATFLIHASNGTFDCVCFFLEEEGILLVVIDLGISFDLEDIEELEHVTQVANQLNMSTKLGHFYVDENLGGVFVKVSQIVRGSEEEIVSTVTDSILICGVMANEGHTLFQESSIAVTNDL